MAKRKNKLSKVEQLEKDLNKWLARKDDAIDQLIKSMGKLKELRRAEARLDKRERNPKPKQEKLLDVVAEITDAVEAANKRIAVKAADKRKRSVSEVTNIPVSELPIADVLPDDYKKLSVTRTRKRKAEAVA